LAEVHSCQPKSLNVKEELFNYENPGWVGITQTISKEVNSGWAMLTKIISRVGTWPPGAGAHA